MRKGFIVFSVLMLAIAAADVSAQMGSRRGSGRVGPDRAAKTQEKPQNNVDQLPHILAELQEDLKLTAYQQAAGDGNARNVEARGKGGVGKGRKWGRVYYKSKVEYEGVLGEHISELSSLQTLLYANDRHAVLLIFQAMDAAGKDGAIKHVMSGVNPQGCQVYSFKHPSAEELEHDFLWRTTRNLPERGRIGIFNRSYYEEGLIV